MLLEAMGRRARILASSDYDERDVFAQKFSRTNSPFPMKHTTNTKLLYCAMGAIPGTTQCSRMGCWLICCTTLKSILNISAQL